MKEIPTTWLFPFAIHQRCKKHLVFVDSQGAKQLSLEVQRMSSTGYPVEYNFVEAVGGEVFNDGTGTGIASQKSWSEISDSQMLKDYLENQPMGTHLYIASSFMVTRQLVRVAEAVGYAAEDIQVRAYGQKYHQVFCIACYTINPIKGESTVTCLNCGQLLAVSEHYSKRLDAVLGHIVLKNFSEKGNS